ncbi:hypothetical protein [Tsukamurella hominis]
MSKTASFYVITPRANARRAYDVVAADAESDAFYAARAAHRSAAAEVRRR